MMCHCVSCGECGGRGTVEVRTDGYPEYDLETCPECRGTGLSEICDDCRECDDEYDN